MFKSALIAFCPPVLRKWQVRVESTPLGYRLVRGAFWSLVGSLISKGLGMLAGIVVARVLGKHFYGQLGMVQSTAGTLGIFAGFGMGVTANRHVAEFRRADPERAGRIIALSSVVSWVTGGIMTVVLVALAPWLARTTLGAPEMGGLLRSGSLLLLLGGVNGAQTGALAGFEAFKTIARVNLIAGLAAFPITLVCAWFWGVEGSVWALVANLALNCFLNFVALRQEAARFGVPLSYAHCGEEWRVLWHFSIPAVLGGAIAGPTVWAVSTLLVNQPDGYSQMGVYNAVYRIRIVPEMILNMLLAPLLPVLTERYAAGDVKGYHKTAYSAFMLSMVVVAPFALIQIAFPALTLLPYGPGYAGHAGVVQWLMFDLVITGVFAPYSQLVTSMSKMWFGFVSMVSWTALFAVFSVFLVPRYGAAGFAAAPILGHLVCLAPCLIYLYRAEPVFMKGLPLLKLIPALAGLGAVSYACWRWLPPAATIGLGCLFVLALWPFRHQFLDPIMARSRVVDPS
jgi:O-antigen/teichoic acid export membrane protein